MAIKDRVTVKSYFETGDVPTQAQFEDLIDSAASLSGYNYSIGNWDIVGNVVVTGTVSATFISATRIDLKEYEVSGFSVNGGDLMINGGDVIVTSVGSLVSGIPSWDATTARSLDNAADIMVIAAASGDWNTAVSTTIPAIQLDIMQVADASGNWGSTHTSVLNTSSYWDTAYTKVVGLTAQANTSTYDIANLAASGSEVYFSTANVSNPPTSGEIVGIFGAAATVGGGRIGLIDDNNAGINVYLVASDGTFWWQTALTKATD